MEKIPPVALFFPEGEGSLLSPQVFYKFSKENFSTKLWVQKLKAFGMLYFFLCGNNLITIEIQWRSQKIGLLTFTHFWSKFDTLEKCCVTLDENSFY